MKRNLVTLKDFSPEEVAKLMEFAAYIKKNPFEYSNAMEQKTLLMLFEKPSLRTRLSFEAGMTQMGGHAIFYSIKDSPLGKKESMYDTAKCASRYCNIIMARLFKHSDIEELAKTADVPVINALTNFSHPCQVLSDLLTIKEKKGTLKGLKLAYLGDSNNNVTHSLLYGCALTGIDIAVACPAGYKPMPLVIEQAKSLAKNSSITITHDAIEAAKDADIIYTDSWMSYHIKEEDEEKRVKIFEPYQVNTELMKHAKQDAIFMNCLPAKRGYEQTAEVIDGSQSVVFDQAENRLHMQKAIMLTLIKK